MSTQKWFGKKRYVMGSCLLAGMLACVSEAPASASESLNLGMNSSHYMSMPDSIVRVAIGNSAIASVVHLPPSDSEFLIVTKDKPGMTSLMVFLADGEIYEYKINVSPDDEGQAQMIEDAIGLPNVHVKKIGNRVLLTGTIRDQYERNYAVQTARLFVGAAADSSISVGSYVNMSMETRSTDDFTTSGDTNTVGGTTVGGNEGGKANIIDLLQMENPTQIRLEAQIIAVNPEDISQIGLRYGGSDPRNNPGLFFVGESYGEDSSRTFANNPWAWITARHNPINVAINAMVQNNKAKILSRPSLVTMSGEEAAIQVGGQIPYQTTNANGATSIQFKDYGVILQIKPIVDSEGRVVSTIHAEVSSRAGETPDGQIMLDKRSADSVVTVEPGSTMVIGGLLDSTESKNVTKIPLLGNIPIIGEFFKYSSTQEKKQEMMILITPYVVEEADRSRTRMSNTMREWYNGGQLEKQNMQEVDVNEPVLDEKAQAQKEASGSADKDSLLGKYLDRNVLPDGQVK